MEYKYTIEDLESIASKQMELTLAFTPDKAAAWAAVNAGAQWAGVLVMIHTYRLKVNEVTSAEILAGVLRHLPKAEELSND